MLLATCILLVILWSTGILFGYTLGGFIHLLLVGAIIVLIVRIFHKANAA
jgi:hypothetical protein